MDLNHDLASLSHDSLRPRDPVVSVLMLAYNHACYIRKAIESILGQVTTFPFELIIGEDCSPDGTLEIALEYQRSHPGIVRVITSAPNVGEIENLRRSILACRGRYVAFCEGDDYWHAPHKLEAQVTFLDSHPEYVLVHSEYRSYCIDSGRWISNAARQPEDLDDADAFNEILSCRRIVLTVTACIRLKTWEVVMRECPECFDPRFLMRDTQMWLELSRRGKVKCIHEVLATYQILPESSSQSKDPARALRFRISCKDVLDHYIQKYGCPTAVMRAAKSNSAMIVLSAAYEAGAARIARAMLAEYRKFDIPIPLLAGLYAKGSSSITARRLIRPALSVLLFWSKVSRRLSRVMKTG